MQACSVFEGIQEPFLLSLACKSVSIKPCLCTQLPEDSKSYRKVSRGWGHLITWNGPMMGHLNSFSASGGGNLNKNFPKIQMPGGLPGGGMLKLRFGWYIKLDPDQVPASSPWVSEDGKGQEQTLFLEECNHVSRCFAAEDKGAAY